MSAQYLNNTLEELKQYRHQESTKRNYHTIWKNLNNFVLRLDVMPPTWEKRVALYCGYLVDECGVQSSTLKSYVSAIKDTLLMDGYDWKDDKMLMSTLTKSCRMKNDKVRNRFPIQDGLLDILLYEIIQKYRESQPFLEIMYKNMFSMDVLWIIPYW